MNSFYQTKAWKRKREHILRRDGWKDQILLAEGVTREADTVHHILPLEQFPEHALADWNLISVNNRLTHLKRLHKRYGGELTKEGKELMLRTAKEHGVKVGMVTMVIGRPGTGKSTWTKEHLGGGIAYELDSIACAFRLCRPHDEEIHAGARRMAAALRRAWIAEAPRYASQIFVVRTAPDDDELAETMPDRLVVCHHQFTERPYVFNPAEYDERIENAIEWANANGIAVEWYPPRVPD